MTASILVQRASAALRRPTYSNRVHRCIKRQSGSQNGPAQITYFQQPPAAPKEPKVRWRIVRGGLIACASFMAGALLGLSSFESALRRHGIDPQILHEDESSVLLDRLDSRAMDTQEVEIWNTMVRALLPNYINPEHASAWLNERSFHSVKPAMITHACRLPSNTPCEDQFASVSFRQSGDTDQHAWQLVGIFDGHAGARTSAYLVEHLPIAVISALTNVDVWTRPFVPNDQVIISALQESFEAVDNTLLQFANMAVSAPLDARGSAVAAISLFDQGSCAIVAVYDPNASVLRVANTGDSRAVLGRWDNEQGQYVAVAMSKDHTGFNQDEVERLEAEHPGESVIDASTGRLFGLAVTRAFGDSRWKFPEEFTTMIHERFWANPPRPKNVVKTPPYLTARPEVTEANVNKGDFLIVATDGLWDQLSSEQAVELVQMWLDKHKPKDVILRKRDTPATAPEDQEKIFPDNFEDDRKAKRIAKSTDDDDIYYDEAEKVLKWRNTSKYFSTKSDCCASHLIENALGGDRTGLLAALIALPPPGSRSVRDDITVSVMFFGADTSGVEEESID